MKVFLSWSGERSRAVAEALSSWIRQLIQAAETWISSDIDKGSRWNDKISNELESTKVGIICLVAENLSSEWLLFEAGALSKTRDAYVCTFLLDITPANIQQPLGQFQHTISTKDDLKRLIFTINKKIATSGEKTISDKDLEDLFEILFPKIEQTLSEIKRKNTPFTTIVRTDRQILEEILETVRQQKEVITAINAREEAVKLSKLIESRFDELTNIQELKTRLEQDKYDRFQQLHETLARQINERTSSNER
ncbi:MAG TPA: TIR domain-containing protein [Parafilimonas sp.]|nr:TIR domain-containing protein [Parafilimonas sp.]